jgi:hypothetical protein
MAKPLYRQLLAQAEQLARLDHRRPQQANLRRSVSAPYYGLFHFLVEQASRQLLGGSGANRRERMVLSRASKHATMANACKAFGGNAMPKEIAVRLGPMQSSSGVSLLAKVFVMAQEKRHLADYDGLAHFARYDCLYVIAEVRAAIDRWQAIRNTSEVRFFLACLVVWNDLKK